MLAAVVASLISCGPLRAARGCGMVPLDPALAAPVPSAPAAPIADDARERLAREIVARRVGLPIEDVVVAHHLTQSDPAGPTAYAYKLNSVDGRYLGVILLDAGGHELSEAALGLERILADARARGKVDTQLSDAVARALPGDLVPVMFDVVAPAWDGPPRPWPSDLSGEAWNAFVDRYADAFYRPRVTPFIDHLRSIGARDIDPTLAPDSSVRGPSVFARVPADQVCVLARRSDVLRAGYNPPIVLN